MTPQGYYYASNNFFTAEHGGTHLDAPIHFSQGAQTVEQIPVERFLGRAVIVDVTAQADKDRDYRVTTEDLQRAESEQGAIPSDAILLIRTGFLDDGPTRPHILGRPSAAPMQFATCTSPVCIRMRPDGWLRIDPSRPWELTRRASTTVSRRCMRCIGRCSSATFLPLKTSPRSSACRCAARLWWRFR